MNTLIGTKSNNPLRNHTNDKNLADEFANFYEQNQRIRDNLTENPVYQTTGKNISRLAEFRPFNQTEV